MSRSRTIGTIFASIALGALTFFLTTTPKKVVKKKEQQTSQDDRNSEKEDLFI